MCRHYPLYLGNVILNNSNLEKTLTYVFTQYKTEIFHNPNWLIEVPVPGTEKHLMTKGF